jgi:outer membrane protein assembly factor BamB
MKSSHLISEKLLIVALIVSLVFASHTAASPHDSGDEQSSTFSKCWDLAVTADLSVSVTSDGDTVYLVDTDRKLSAVDLATGTRLWSSELAGDPVSNVLVTGGHIIVASQPAPDRAVLRSVSKTTGITQWSADLPWASSVALGTLNGTVVAVSSSGMAAAFQTDRGTASWTKKIGAVATTAPFFHGKMLVVGTDRKELVSISLPGGESTVVMKLDGSPTAIFSTDSGSILVGDDRGNLILTSIQGKREWKFRNGARISAIAGYDSEYLATSHDNFLYKLTRGGNVEWKRRLSARIDKPPIVLGETAVVATVGDGSVYVVDLTNGKISNRIETGEETSAQVAGGKTGFAIVATKGLSFYGTNGCSPPNKKTVPDAAPPREKS